MRFTATMSTRGQLTIPKEIRKQIGLEAGMKVDIYLSKEGFASRIDRKSRILEFLGDLKDAK